MKRYQLTTLVIVVVLAFVSLCSAQSDKDKVIGTWKLIAIEDTSPNPAFPDLNPVGYITYDSAGRMAMQMIRRSDIPKFKSNDLAKATDAEIKAAFLAYGAYYGTYEVHQKEGLIIHQVEGNLFPNNIGNENIRYYEISGDRITLIVTSRGKDGKIPPKSASKRRLIWERVK